MKAFTFGRKEKVEDSNASGINYTVTFLAFRPDIEKYQRNVGTTNGGRLLSNVWVKRVRFLLLFRVWRVSLSFFTPHDPLALGNDGTWPGYSDGEDMG